MNYELMQLISQLIPQNLLELPQKLIFGPLLSNIFSVILQATQMITCPMLQSIIFMVLFNHFRAILLNPSNGPLITKWKLTMINITFLQMIITKELLELGKLKKKIVSVRSYYS